MKYRSKSSDRVIEEMKYCTERYRVNAFQFTDNILDPRYIKELFPTIKSKNMDVWMYYETKSNLTREQLKCMKQAGVEAIQPGIESFSNIVLNIMQKGVTGLQNNQLLKWCREIGIWPFWNILTGFPGEPEEEYDKMAELVPLLVHLHPPEAFTRIQLSRFSPYHMRPQMYGITNTRPLQAYELIYPLSREDIMNMVYFFDYDYIDNKNPESYTSTLGQHIEEWKKLWKEGDPPQLNMVYVGENMTIIKDTRPCSLKESHILIGLKSRIFRICEISMKFDTIFQKINFENPDIRVRSRGKSH